MDSRCLLLYSATFAILCLDNGPALQNGAVMASNQDGSYVKTTERSATTAAPTNEKRWLIYVSAGPTILIFLVCVITICIKRCADEDDGFEKHNEVTILSAAVGLNSAPAEETFIKGRPKMINEVYDKMLEQFKDDKNKNKTFVGRKCSQIHIQGVESGSPKSLARKHLIIGKFNQNENSDDESPPPVKSLVKSSTSAILGAPVLGAPWMEQIRRREQDEKKKERQSVTSLVRHSSSFMIGTEMMTEIQKSDSEETLDNLDINVTLRNIIGKSSGTLTEADRRTFCDELDEVLLPEDLEEAFRNFESWAESYA